MTFRPSPGIRWLLVIACAAVLVRSAILEWVWVRPALAANPLAPPGASATGHLPLQPDGMLWLRETRRMIEQGECGLRSTDADHPHRERPIHWSSLPAWWLALGGGAVDGVTGCGFRAGLERFGVWSNPLLHLLALCAVARLGCKRFGGPAGIWLALLLALPGAILNDFTHANPDHHGWNLIAAVGATLFLVPAGERRLGRSDAVGSACFGALGLWLNASPHMVLLGTLGLAIAVAAWRRMPGIETFPVRVWGWTGAALAAVAYALDLRDTAPPLRLEYLTPLHAAAWAAGGELLGWWIGVHTGRAQAGDRVRALLACGGLLLLPAALLWGPPEWSPVRHPPLAGLLRNTREMRPIFDLEGISLLHGFWLLGAAPILPLLALAHWKQATAGDRLRLWLPLAPTSAFLAWSLFNQRWLGLACGLAACLIPGLLGEPVAASRGWIRWRPALWVGSIAIAAAVIGTGVDLLRLARKPAGAVPPELDLAMAIRQTAARIETDRAGELRVLTDPLVFFPLVWHSDRLRICGSGFADDGEALAANCEFFAAAGEAEARALLRRMRITHVVLSSTPKVAERALDMLGEPTAPRRVERALGYRLAHPAAPTPSWLERLDPEPQTPAARWGIRVFRVRDP